MSILGEALVRLHKYGASAAMAHEQKKGTVPGFVPLTQVKDITKESMTRQQLAEAAIQQGQDFEQKGKKVRNIGYMGAVGAGGASFLPRSQAARWGLRGAALLSGLGGYLGEGGMRVGKGYQVAGRELLGQPVENEMAGLTYSPSAYQSVLNAADQMRKKAMVNELKNLNAVTPAQLQKLAATPVSEEEAQRSFNRLEKMEAFKPTAKQIGRYATLGAVAGPALSAVGSAIKGKPYLGVAGLRQAAKGGLGSLAREAFKPEGAARTILSDATRGAVASGLIPVARQQLDVRGEMGTLKKYIQEQQPAVA